MLPNEMINHVAQYCKTPDFISLRNTCKRFRTIHYHPGRTIVVGNKSKIITELRINRFTFFALFITLLYTALLFLLISIIFFTVKMSPNDEAQLITGIVFACLTVIIVILDIIFLISSLRVFKKTKYSKIIV